MAKFTIGIVDGCLKQPSPAAAAAAAVEAGADGLQVYARGLDDGTIAEAAAEWKAAVAGTPLRLLSAVVGFPQEDYSSIATIHRTGGLAPDEAAERNVARAIDAARFAQQIGADLLTFHAGFIPESADDPFFGKLVERIGRAGDAAADLGVRIGLESGQETAAALLRFLDAVGRANVGVNFDPANLILYGRQQPLEAVDLLAGRIFQVHAKDGTWSDKPGETWGRETALGDGDVDFGKLLSRLRNAGFAGALVIEREAGANPLADIRDGVALLRSLQ